MQRLVRSGAVKVNSKAILVPSHSVAGEDEIFVAMPNDAVAEGALTPEDIDLDLVHVDADIIVIDKPAGLAVHPGTGRSSGTLANALLHEFPEMSEVGDAGRPGIVHRLDIDTSGLLVVARTSLAFESLSTAIRTREIDRRYTTLVKGKPQPEIGIVDAPIGRDPNNPTRQAINAGGRPARTRYRVAHVFGRDSNLKSLLEIKLETGRTHQIRVHMQAIGHPVVGDPTYGGNDSMPGLERQFLHAHRLLITHPATGEPLRFNSSLPEDLTGVLSELNQRS